MSFNCSICLNDFTASLKHFKCKICNIELCIECFKEYCINEELVCPQCKHMIDYSIIIKLFGKTYFKTSYFTLLGQKQFIYMTHDAIVDVADIISKINVYNSTNVEELRTKNYDYIVERDFLSNCLRNVNPGSFDQNYDFLNDIYVNNYEKFIEALLNSIRELQNYHYEGTELTEEEFDEMPAPIKNKTLYYNRSEKTYKPGYLILAVKDYQIFKKKCNERLIKSLIGRKSLEYVTHVKDINFLNTKLQNITIKLNEFKSLEKFKVIDEIRKVLKLKKNNGLPKIFDFVCPEQDCLGKLYKTDDGYKCNICNSIFCLHCLGKINNGVHACDIQEVNTFIDIIRNTVPCPKCSTRIYRISGCDDMFCTNCHTGFSYRTGKIKHGNFHNPHRQEFIRNHPELQEHELDCDYTLSNAIRKEGKYNKMINYYNRITNFVKCEKRKLKKCILGKYYNLVKYAIKNDYFETKKITEEGFKKFLNTNAKTEFRIKMILNVCEIVKDTYHTYLTYIDQYIISHNTTEADKIYNEFLTIIPEFQSRFDEIEKKFGYYIVRPVIENSFGIYCITLNKVKWSMSEVEELIQNMEIYKQETYTSIQFIKEESIFTQDEYNKYINSNCKMINRVKYIYSMFNGYLDNIIVHATDITDNEIEKKLLLSHIYYNNIHRRETSKLTQNEGRIEQDEEIRERLIRIRRGFVLNGDL